MAEYIQIYYHHGGLLSRDKNGKMAYVNGKVESLGEVDADYVNLNDIETIYKHFGYEKCEKILWLEPDVPNFELALKPLTNDADINAMCEAALKNDNEMHVYFENCISRPEFVDEAEFFQGPEHGGEEADGEDEEGEEDEGEGEEEGEKEENDKRHNDKNKVSQGKMTQNDEDEESEEDEGEEEENEEEEDEGHMSFEEGRGYDYHSEELRTPPSSDDDADFQPPNPKFNDQSAFGHVQLELGMEFVSLKQFKNAVIDYNIALGREFVWVKNDKVRARAKCHNKECDWMIFCGWNSKISCFQIKTYNEVLLLHQDPNKLFLLLHQDPRQLQ